MFRVGFLVVLFILLVGCGKKVTVDDLKAHDWVVKSDAPDDPNLLISFSDHVMTLKVDIDSFSSTASNEWEALGEEFAKSFLDQMNYKLEYTLDKDTIEIQDADDTKKTILYNVTTEEDTIIFTPADKEEDAEKLILQPRKATKDTKKDTQASSTSTDLESITLSSETTQSVDPNSDFVPTADDASFDGKILKGNTYSVKITDYKVIPAGEGINEYGDAPIIAFYYDTLVAPDYDNSMPVDASSAWMYNFTAVQDNDPNTVNELNWAMLSYDDDTYEGDAEIKPGGTVSSVVGYELTDSETAVTLSARDMFGTEFGSFNFEIK